MQKLSPSLVLFGEAEERAITQITSCITQEPGSYGVLCADNHPGYSQPIGGAVAYRNHISPTGVGYDIGCGNKAVKTNLKAAEINISKVMDEIASTISFGVGRKNSTPVDHPVLEQIAHAAFTSQRQLANLAASQLGTVGSGNHYVDLFEDESGWLWVGVHFGSRGFGHRTASGFLAMAQGLAFDEQVIAGERDSAPVLFSLESEIGQAYREAMQLAGAYAYAGRDVVVDSVLAILGATATNEVHNHHNFAWEETHFGEKWCVVRKGCTPAFPGQRGFVGGSMGDISVILKGVDAPESAQALYSTIHGAGRIMSRTQALGRFTKVKEVRKKPDGSEYIFSRTEKEEGRINWGEALNGLTEKGIVLRGGGADEAPGVYRSLESVLAAHAGTIEVEHRLRVIGVAMAGKEVKDPYKD